MTLGLLLDSVALMLRLVIRACKALVCVCVNICICIYIYLFIYMYTHKIHVFSIFPTSFSNMLFKRPLHPKLYAPGIMPINMRLLVGASVRNHS